MEIIPILIVAGQGLFFLGCVVALIYLIARRIKIKEQETFEKRDN